MSTFSVPIKRIRAIEAHPNADAIEFAVIDGYRSIVKKNQVQVGDLVAYIPEASLLPEWLLRALALWDDVKGKGKLNGKNGNRVKAVKLRGELSQGICYPARFHPDAVDPLFEGPAPFYSIDVDPITFGVRGFVVREGDDVASLLGIEKYEPPIPVALAGEVFNAGQRLTSKFDIENWKSFPDVLREGEDVVFTEKLHGTFTGISILPLEDAHPEAFGKNKNILLFSKGLGGDGLVFKDNEANVRNTYVIATRGIIERIDELGIELREPMILMGETFGPGVQDLPYGKAIGFRMFAVARGYRGDQRYCDFDEMLEIAKSLGVETVPVLYRGAFSVEAMREYTDGMTSMDAEHIREGIVMTPTTERYDHAIGRVSLKSVSGDYLTRKGGTEYQ